MEPVPAPVREPPSPATTDLWSQYVASLDNVGFASIVRMAKLTGIESDVAIISFPRTAESFVRQWSANGKKDQIARGLTALRGPADRRPFGNRRIIRGAGAGCPRKAG